MHHPESLLSVLTVLLRQDVADCLSILDAAVSAGLVDGARASYVGGSHGGFLGGHLAGQAPDRFRCISLRNPVTNIASMVGVTDIPDWCFVETPGLGVNAFAEPPTAEQLAAMQARKNEGRVGTISSGLSISAVPWTHERPPIAPFAAAKRHRSPRTRPQCLALAACQHAPRPVTLFPPVTRIPAGGFPSGAPRCGKEPYFAHARREGPPRAAVQRAAGA